MSNDNTEKMDIDTTATDKDIKWFVWNWNKDKLDKSSIRFTINFNNIVVSESWIKANINEPGNVVAGPFNVLKDAISKCDELNG